MIGDHYHALREEGYTHAEAEAYIFAEDVVKRYEDSLLRDGQAIVYAIAVAHLRRAQKRLERRLERRAAADHARALAEVIR